MGAFDPVVALILVLGVAILLRLAWRKLFVRGRETSRLGRWLAESTGTPVFLLILAVGAQVIVGRLALLPPLRDLSMTPYLTGGAYVLTVLCLTWVAYGLVKGTSEWYLSHFAPQNGSKLDAELIPAFRRLAKLLLIFFALTVILDHYDVKLTAILGAAGLASLAVALAAQDTLANMIAGFTIMIDRPFRLGDRIELANGRTGDVHEIGLRSTRILSPDHTVYIIPNSELAKSSVINHSYPSDRVKVRQKIAVAWGSDAAVVKQILVEACRAHPLVLPDPPPSASLSELGDQGLQVSFHFWLADYRTRGQVVDETNMVIYERLREAGVRLPERPALK
ncbi:MAG: mechanosensitive ion channel [Acidobacteria bacterium]|nr:mechanosensitive ion channel [Acidobacteriota bacterium]